jgi:hypothetical protein
VSDAKTESGVRAIDAISAPDGLVHAILRLQASQGNHQA